MAARYSYIMAGLQKINNIFSLKIFQKMKRVTNGFPQMSIPKFNHQLSVIITGMTNNANFNSLQGAVAALKAEADIYFALATKAAKRDQDVILARDASREKVTNMLHNLGMDVSAIAKGDVNILSSSGFPFTQPRQPSPPMVKPAPPTVSLGVNNGEIDCRTSTQPGMKSVNYYITSDATALAADSTKAWDVTSYNKTKFTFSSLTPGQRYFIKIGLVGVKGQEVISDPVSYIAQ